MRIDRLHVLFFALVLAGCGGGGGSGNPDNPPPPDPGTVLPVTLVSTGSFHASNPSAALSGFRAFTTLAELDAFQAAGVEKPVSLRSVDFNVNAVLYLEGPADDFLPATVRLVEFRRFDGTRETVTGERCTNDVAGIPTPSRAQRPYAFYIVPKLLSTTFAATARVGAACTTVETVSPLTRAAVGDWNSGFGRPQPPVGLQVIRTQAQLDAVLPSFALGDVPPQYRAPDFSEVTLLFVAGAGDNDPQSYVRVDRVLANDDGTREVIAEYCGDSTVFIGTHIPFALYVVPRFDTAARLVAIERIPGACALPR